MIKITAKGIGKVQKNLSTDLKPSIGRGIKRVVEVVHEAVIQEAPERSGKLRRSIKRRQTGPLSWNVTEGEAHGLYIRRGTPAHPITPLRNKRALAWPGISHPVARVRHPGIRRLNDYPSRAVAKSQPEIQAEMDRVGGELVVKLEG